MRVTIRWTGFIAAPSFTLSKDVGTEQGLGVDIDMGSKTNSRNGVHTGHRKRVHLYICSE